jgi:hypothetical protein
MSDLTTLLQAANVTRAVIVDDAFDQVPLARDLSLDVDNWARFFEDLTEKDEQQIRTVFPRYDELRGDQLQSENEFVAVLWNKKLTLRADLIDELFGRYRRDKDQDLGYLETLTQRLGACGLQCTTAGRSFDFEAAEADLIVIDLYLGSTQDNEAMETSLTGLKKVIKRRLAKPPLVLLMSRSSRLEDKRKQFRDESGLFESAFRIIRKAELAEEGKLQRILTRLADHYSDSVKLAAFLHAWQEGLSSACARTANLIRTLDLADHAQIQQLLLTDEGEPPGSYLVDIFDLVLRHEIEREAAIINAALELNGLNTDVYPPPYVAGSPDLQALVYRSLFQNNGRLRLMKPNGSRVVFGDILRRKSVPGTPTVGTEPAADNLPLGDVGPLDVLAVLTPACDLQRLATKRVLLLKGSLIPLTHANWAYEESSIRTAVFETSSKERFQVKWDLKHIETISPDELNVILTSPNGFEVAARLREAHALEIQQKLLSSLGRVGLIAPMPATFPVKIEAYLPDVDKRLFKLTVPALTNNQGVYFVGRKNEKPARTLVLCEDACEALCEAIQSIDLERVHPTTRETILELRAGGELLILQRGVDCSGVTDQTFREIVSVHAAAAERSQERRAIGLIRKIGAWMEQPLNGSFLRKAGVVLVVSD